MRSLSLPALLLLAAGCASTPIPKDKLALAEQAVQRAEAAGAAEHASGDLALAREKLAQANAAADEETSKAATEVTRLAEQSAADARLAEARAESAKAQKAVTEMEDGLRALREEASRPVQR